MPTLRRAGTASSSAELEALVAEHPLSERLHGQLMLALYRSGRQAEALDAYRQARELLVEAVGIEPGPDLQRLHAAMLSQDASLDPPPRPELPPELGSRSPMFGREAELAACERRGRALGTAAAR